YDYCCLFDDYPRHHLGVGVAFVWRSIMTGEVAPNESLIRVDEIGGLDAPREALVAGRLDSVVIRFAGDSGDGMQLTGSQFATTSALIGNDIATMPDFPAEIRAPAGTLPGVSSFQLQFSSGEIFT